MKLTPIAAFVKFNREKLGITQLELAEKTGTGIRFIRDLEQGKLSIRLDKADKVLALFGHRLAPVSDATDPYQLWYAYKEKAVEVTLTNKTKHQGFLMKEIRDARNTIVGWLLVPFPNILEWTRLEDEKIATRINQNEIAEITILQHEQIRKGLHAT